MILAFLHHMLNNLKAQTSSHFKFHSNRPVALNFNYTHPPKGEICSKLIYFSRLKSGNKTPSVILKIWDAEFKTTRLSVISSNEMYAKQGALSNSGLIIYCSVILRIASIAYFEINTIIHPRRKRDCSEFSVFRKPGVLNFLNQINCFGVDIKFLHPINMAEGLNLKLSSRTSLT